jgi:hypothetical protein
MEAVMRKPALAIAALAIALVLSVALVVVYHPTRSTDELRNRCKDTHIGILLQRRACKDLRLREHPKVRLTQ